MEPLHNMPIADLTGMTMYMRAADHFGSMNPNSIDDYFFSKFELEEAERSGCLPQKLARLGLSSKDDWWRVEASYYRRHFGHLESAEGHRQFASAARVARSRIDRSLSARITAPRPSAGLDDAVAPCTFDRYVEVTSAHEAWGESGRDAAGLLVQMFGMSLRQLSQVVRYWATRCSIDSNLASKYAHDKAHCKKKYIGGGYVTMT